MNNSQKLLSWVALAVFALTLCCVPWTVTRKAPFDNYFYTKTETAPIWNAPVNSRVNIATLVVEWFGIAVVYGALFFLLRDRGKPNFDRLPS